MPRLIRIAVLLCVIVRECRPEPADNKTRLDWLRELRADLRKVMDPMVPPLLLGQTERDMHVNLTISGKIFGLQCLPKNSHELKN